MRYLKTYESFREPSNREEMIETLTATSTFEREELEAMTDDELEDLFHSLETEDWLDELDRESTGRQNWIGGPYHSREEEEGDYYEESYTFEDFTHADMEDVRELLEMGLTEDQIAIELDFSLEKVKQIVESIRKNQQMFNESSIYIPLNYSGIRMELGEDVDSNDIIDMYNQLVSSEGESLPLMSYSESGTEGKFYNEENDEIPLDVILDELNYAIGLDSKDELESLDEAKKSGVTASLKKKSKASGIPMGILRKVFAKGMQAWNAGHRPGVAQHQWGMGRVNSFITGAGGARKADADLWSKAKAAKARKKKRKK